MILPQRSFSFFSVLSNFPAQHCLQATKQPIANTSICIQGLGHFQGLKPLLSQLSLPLRRRLWQSTMPLCEFILDISISMANKFLYSPPFFPSVLIISSLLFKFICEDHSTIILFLTCVSVYSRESSEQRNIIPSLEAVNCFLYQIFLKFKFEFIYSHLFNCNTTTIRKNRRKNRANYTLN